MKLNIIILSVSLFVGAFTCFADSTYKTLFEEAQVAYQKGDFQASLHKFMKLKSSRLVAPEVYYNIANCYFKLGRLGKAILFYERARNLQKRDEDIHANLSIAKTRLKDRWKESPKSFLSEILSTITRNFSSWELTLFNVILLWLLMIGSSLIQVGKEALMRVFFILVITLFLLSTACLIASLREEHSSRAILTKNLARVRSGPGTTFPVTLTIHEGTSLNILEQNGDWSKAVFPDQSIGWLKSKSYEFIQENTKI